ncbi:hypothetical protein [Candidatus Frankia nodulisporulans]|uniref:hypothetical protein n=1 Tax=Candidatus Frankia nodulisporulans TaxID=2060052 RepID=UPI0013CFECF8|nr:hypothetical protein [Candidatus Frankia nodulisporulans]
MTTRCPRCRGTRFVGRGKNRGPCPACTGGGIGDRAVGAVQRAADRLTGRRLDVDGRTTTSRAHLLATETTRTRAPKKKTATRRKTTATPAAVVMPACDRCGTRGPLTVTSCGAICAAGCTPTAS